MAETREGHARALDALAAEPDFLMTDKERAALRAGAAALRELDQLERDGVIVVIVPPGVV